MERQVSPEAFFDSLSLAHKLDNYLDGFRLEEIHLFSYFSSFLYAYSGQSITTWSHRYTSSAGYPFSMDINEANQRHIQNGFFEERGESYVITGRGTDEFNKFKQLPTFIKREAILNAACTTSIIIPYSETLRALLNEPDLKKAQQLGNSSWLDQMNFYPQFETISKAVGVNSSDLLLPAVTWINYLQENTNSNAN